MKKTIICVAPISHLDNIKNNPITPEEVAKEVYECYLQGATVAHLHVRDKDGKPTKNIENFLYTVKMIREKCPIIINVAYNDFGLIEDYVKENKGNKEVNLVAVHPGSITLFDFALGVTRKEFEDQFLNALNCKMNPEVCVFDVGMVNNAKELVSKYDIKNSYYYGVYLGYPGEMPARLKDIQYISECIGNDAEWFYTECDRKGYVSIAQALILGGNIRVGYEDSVYDSEGVIATSNHQIVKKVADLSRLLGRQVANIEETCEMLGVEFLYKR